MKAVKRISHYVTSTNDFEIWFSKDSKLLLDLVMPTGQGTYQIECVLHEHIFFGTNLISWFCCKQHFASLSTAEVQQVVVVDN